jgi:glycosyltransferase involved in cell wall biosynthesis
LTRSSRCTPRFVYEAVCVGFNLLRNDVSFCGGPPPGSLACRICVYGEDRDAHLSQLERLFAAIPFHVAAPSNAALAIWNDAARLPHASVQVHEYVRIRPSAIRSSLIGATSRGTADNPVRIAFIGYAVTHKGWPAFVEIAAAIDGLAAYQAFHFTALPADPALPNVQTVMAKVVPGARSAMTDALVANSIDLVLVLSTWPETFCLVAYEAIASGADVIALDGSGNVADMVLASGRGLVMPDTAAIVEFLTSGAAIEYVRMCGEQGSEIGRLESRGMTATLILPDVLSSGPSER